MIGVRGIGAFFGFGLMALASRLDPRVSLTIAFSLQGLSGLYMASFNIDMTFSQVASSGRGRGRDRGRGRGRGAGVPNLRNKCRGQGR